MELNASMQKLIKTFEDKFGIKYVPKELPEWYNPLFEWFLISAPSFRMNEHDTRLFHEYEDYCAMRRKYVSNQTNQ